MNERFPCIRRYASLDDIRFLRTRESVSITFYMRRDHPEVAQAVLRALEVYRRAVDPQALAWYLEPYEADWLGLDSQGWEYIQREVLNSLAARIWLRETYSNTTGHEVIYSGHPLEKPLDDQGRGTACALAFFLPTEYLEEHGPGRVRELALELAAGLPFNSGHAGLSFLFPEGLVGTTETIRAECLRYPGMDVPRVQGTSHDIGTRVKGAHWLTFLGQPVLGELGGAAGLRARLRSPGTTVQELEGERVVVTLGAWPEAGDLEQGRTLPAYRELARVLEPWLYEERFCIKGLSPEELRRWQRRFLD